MRKYVFLPLLASVFLLSSCKIDSVSFSGGKMIEPSSHIVKKEYPQKAFDEVDVDIVANVKVIQAGSGDYRVVLSCPDNYVDLFKFDNNEGELEVRFARRNVNIEPKHVDITVYTPELHSLENSGVASVEIDRLKTSQLSVENAGVGSIYLAGLVAEKVEADCSGVGHIELKGQADRADLECSGVGSIKAEELKAKSVKAEVSGVGGIKCYASESIDGEVSGVGGLQYGGSPQQKNLRRNGIGGISEL